MRSKIVLACAEGRSNVEVAAESRVHMSTVGKWRRRFLAERLEGLRDEERPGRPPSITLDPVEDVVVATPGSPTGTPTPSRSYGRRPLTKSSTHSPDIYSEFLARHTRSSARPASSHRAWRCSSSPQPSPAAPGRLLFLDGTEGFQQNVIERRRLRRWPRDRRSRRLRHRRRRPCDDGGGGQSPGTPPCERSLQMKPPLYALRATCRRMERNKMDSAR
ncbi:helix-turn-helix domain-containing protein [Streptosporangium canum]